MEFEEPITTKRSLGALRKAEKTKARSPDLIGTLRLQRHTIETIARQFKETRDDEITCCPAGWRNSDHQGTPYLTIELSARFVKRRSEPISSDLVDFLHDDPQDDA